MRLLSLYFHFVKVRIQSQMEYRVSFIMETLSHFCVTFLDFTTIAIIFSRFRALEHWTLWEVAFFYGLVGIAFGFAEMVGRGVDVFPGLVQRGEFDNMLVRPLGTFFQVFAYQFQLRRLGRMSQAFLVMMVASAKLGVSWSIGKALFLVAAILGGSCFFLGLFVIAATICFWTVQSLEVFNIFTYGGVEAAQYPMSIYRYWFRTFFTFVIPLAFVGYFPALILLGKPDPNGAASLLSWLGPAVGPIFFAVTLIFWRFGVTRYQSTGH